MKKAIVGVFLSLFTVIGKSLCQPDPITIQFVEAQPIWENLFADTSFYEVIFQPDINKYTVVSPSKSFRFGDDLFLLSSCSRFNGEDWGYILKRINIKNGDVIWENYSTYYNNGSQDFYRNLYLRPDGNLEMVGVKRHGEPFPDSTFFAWNVGAGHSNFNRKIFDYNSGELLQEISSADTFAEVVPRYLIFYPLVVDSQYLYLQQRGRDTGQDIIWGYDFYTLNNGQNIVDTLSLSEIIFETTEPATNFSYGSPPFIDYLNDSTLVALLVRDRFYPSLFNAQLVWIDIKDLNNIHVRKRLDIEIWMPGQQSDFRNFEYIVQNNSIILSQPYFDENSSEYTSYLTVIDLDGSIKHHLPKSNTNDFNYVALKLIYTSDTHDYYAGFPSKTGREGFDIVKLFHDSDSLHYVSSLTSAIPGEEFTREMTVSKLYDDGILLIGAYTKKVGAIQNSAVKYYAFESSDLGMEVISSTTEYHIKNIHFYPNPSNGNVNFKFETPASGKIQLFDLSGRLRVQREFDESLTFFTNFNEIPSGLYIIKLYDSNGDINLVSKLMIIK